MKSKPRSKSKKTSTLPAKAVIKPRAKKSVSQDVSSTSRDGTVITRKKNHNTAGTRGPVESMQTTVSDGAERRRLKKMLIESEERYRALMETAAEAIMVHQKGKIVYTNPAGMELIGAKDRVELLERNYDDVVHHYGNNKTGGRLDELPLDRLSSHEVKIIRLNGQRIDAEALAAPISFAGSSATQVIIQDVTARKMAEQTMRFQASVLSEVHDAVVAIDNDSRITYYNKGAELLYGSRAADALGKKLEEVDPCGWIPQSNEAEANESLSKRGFWRGSGLHRSLSGDVKYVESSISVLKDESCARIGLLAVMRDITEGRQADSALRESEERYRSLVENSPVAICVQQEGRYVYMNQAGLQLFGADEPMQIIGKNAIEYVHPAYRDSAVEWMHQIEEDSKHLPFYELKILRVNGQAADVEAVVTKTSFGGKPATQALLKDISEIRNTELRLRLQATVLSQVKDAVVAVDSDGRIIFWNRAAELLFKVTAEEAIGQHREMIFGYRPDARNEAGKSSSQSGFLRGENIHILRSGQVIQVESSVSVLTGWSGAPAGWLAVMRDITERKRAEREIKAARDEALRERLRMETIVNTIPSGVFVAEGPDASITLQNEQARNILGREVNPGVGAGERIGRMRKPDGTYFTPDEVPYLHAFRKGEHVRDVEIMLERPDGATITILSQSVPLRDATGAIYGSVSAFNDITERKQAENELRKARAELELRVRERTAELSTTLEALQAEFIVRRRAEKSLEETSRLLENIFATIHVAIAYMDTDFDYIRVNQNYANREGHEPAFYPGRNYFAAIQDSQEQEIFRSVVETGRPYFAYGKPLPAQKIPGSDVTYWDWNVVPVKESDETVTGLVLSAIDVTERKRAEMERARLVAAIEAAAEAVVITETNRGTIQYVNPAFELITGYKREEAVGKTLHILETGRHDEEFYRAMREAIVRDGFWKGRLINKKKDGTHYYEECTYSPVRDESGNIVSYVSIKHDVTEKLRLESIAETVDMMNTIGYAFSGIRHEIGNPISSLLIILGLMKKKFETGPKEVILGYLEQAIAQVERVEYLLTTLKNFNMYENLKITNVQVSDFMEKIVTLVMEDMTKKGIGLEVSTDPDTGSMAADPRALQQALLNIAVNAVDAVAGRPGPKITVHTGKVHGMVRIRISDNGAGIPEAGQKDLFKPFYTSKAHGTGLGLVITKKLVSRMNGLIEIMSRIDEGTTVDIYIPGGAIEH